MASIDIDELERDDFPILNSDIEKLASPVIGMSFGTVDEAQKYYDTYGRENGFCIRNRTSYRNREKELISVLFVCAREGKYSGQNKKEEDKGEEDEEGKSKKRRSCSTQRCECKAFMKINIDTCGRKWEVTVADDTHNHDFVTPSKKMKMRPNRQLPNVVKNLAEAFHKENLKVSKVTSIYGGEHMGINNRKIYNHLQDVRHRNLDGGDAQSVLNYFKEKQAQNPQFFYAIQCDEDGRATNFFWVDSRSRLAYHYFGDVVSFDTTYRTNKYDMPFAPFTGVNHHFQSIQFGCALLQDETEVTFTWLFQTWLEAMGERPPISFLTDQDLGMKGAVASVFPNTCHRLCIWHILKKFGERLAHVYYKKSNFKKEIKKLMWSTYMIEDFEKGWMLSMNKYGLESNEWLQHMYEIRKSWVPVYNRGTFFAGMNTTGRSEGINSFFNEFVTPRTNLREFVVKYEQALKRIAQRENDEDFESEHKLRIVGENEFLLKHAAKVYTRNVFNKFKDEMHEIFNYKVEEEKEVDGLKLFVVTSKAHENQKFVVKLDLQTNEGSCECQNFDFIGILCTHILKVFIRLDIDVIPDHFVITRWRQKANRYRVTNSTSLVSDKKNEESEALRLSHMCQESTKLACLLAPSHEGYKIFIEMLKIILEKFVKIGDDAPPPVHKKNELHSTGASQILLLDPNISQTKGRKKDAKGIDAKEKNVKISTERIRSGIELGSKKKRMCKGCNKLVRHDWRTCPKNPISKTNKALESQSNYSTSDEDEN